MPKCSRFVPALIVTFAYALIVPISILVRMGRTGWPWVWNETAFGFFMVLVFPFAAAVFCCVIRTDLLKRAVMPFSRLNIPAVLFVAMLLLVLQGLGTDFNDPNRLRQPYLLSGPAKVQEFAALHDKIFQDRDFGAGREIYKNETSSLPLSHTMRRLFEICNFVDVGFGVTVFCYILLLALLPEQIDEKSCNHLVFVLACLAVWFPCRAYAEWYMNLSDTSWINTYQAAWVLAFLLVVACVILAIKMTTGSLYHRFVLPAGAISAILGGLAAFHPQWLSQGAVDLSAFQPVFKTGFALAAVALLFYISSSIHQKG
jgi:hypothetical protein